MQMSETPIKDQISVSKKITSRILYLPPLNMNVESQERH